VGALEERGVIDEIADRLAEATSTTAGQGMAILWGSAAGSALVDNIPFTAAMIPVVEQLQAGNETFEDGLWWSLALGACFGGNATLIAAAANVAAAGVLERNGRPITFGRFLAVGLPVTVASLLVATVYLLAFQL
jgi:Na+/H+ antiporter NhaD/arsenite permease-like protein